MTRCSFPPALARLAAIGCCCVFACMVPAAQAALSDRASDAGCSSKPTLVEGSMYKCTTRNGNIAYFNVPGAVASTARTPPPPLPDEKANAQKYADRLARLRQAVALHEKNIEALKRELAASK